MIERNLYDIISLVLYGVISYGKCGMRLLIIKLREEKCRSQLFRTNLANDMSHSICWIVYHGLILRVLHMSSENVTI